MEKHVRARTKKDKPVGGVLGTGAEGDLVGVIEGLTVGEIKGLPVVFTPHEK